MLKKSLKTPPWLALLTGFSCGLTFFFFGPFDIFAGNRPEFLFSFADFGWWALLIAVAVSLVISALLLFLPSKISPFFLAIFVWITVMGYVQGTFLNAGLSYLQQDAGDSMEGPSTGLIVFNTALWILTAVIFVWAAYAMKKRPAIRTVATVALIMVLGMQLAGCASQFGTVFGEGNGSDSSETDTSADGETQEEDKNTYLSTYGLYQVADGDNIIMLVIDRFDVEYLEEILNKEPDYLTNMEEMNGFTLFRDNVTLYSRTYPASCSMITGIEQRSPDGVPFGWKAEEYFNYAFTNSPFLEDLKKNGYHTRMYMDSFYSYRQATPLIGTADNISGTNSYVISDKPGLVGNMLALSAYRYLPHVLKSTVAVSSASFNQAVQYIGDYPLYATDDPKLFAGLAEEGLSFDGNRKTFTYLHMAGCHTPCHLGADGSYQEKATIEESLRGCFALISMYINELKRLGVYDNATILITGDHPSGVNDYRLIRETRLSPVLFKPAHTDITKPLTESTAQVSEKNLHASLVKSAGLKTNHDYGTAYHDVPVGVDIERHYTFGVCLDEKKYIAEYTVRGPGKDFGSWSQPKLTPSADYYYQ